MLLAKGNRVRFKHTGQIGRISALLAADMVNVILDEDGVEIPAFLEDLERYEESIEQRVKAKFVKGKSEKIIKKPENPETESQYIILKSEGIQLAFLPNREADGTVVFYDIFLLNDLEYAALFDFKLIILENIKLQKKDKLNSISNYKIGELLFDQLSDNPRIEIDFWQITTAGTQNKTTTTTKLRPKQFFKKYKMIPLVNQMGYIYKILPSFEKDKKGTKEDLKTYTQKNLQQNTNVMEESLQLFTEVSVKDYANFETELDLHIEKLTIEGKRMNNGEKLRLQMLHFENYIQEAIKVGVERVYVIHGIGKGKLKDAIAQKLEEIPEVSTYKNEYHPKYGVGATEVNFY